MDVNEGIEVFVKIQKKKIWGGGGWRLGVSGRGRVGGVRVDVNEIEVFVKIQKKIFFWGGGGGSVGGGLGSDWGVRVDVSEELKFL